MRAGAACEVSGWGWTSVTGLRTNVMREVKLKVQNEEKCQQFPDYQRQSMICVGDDSGKKASYFVSVVLGCKLWRRLGLDSQLGSQVKVKGHQNEPGLSE